MFHHFIIFLITVLTLPLASGQTDWRDTIQWPEFKALLGPNYPDGAGILVIQSEAPESSGGYFPNPNDSQLTTKTLSNPGGNSTVSGHATRVARLFYGTENSSRSMNSVAQGTDDILVYSASDYIFDLINDAPNTPSDLIPDSRKVHSAAWVAADFETNAFLILSRSDRAIAENGFLLVAGLNNGSNTSVPDGMATTFNALSVGRSTGGHSRNGTDHAEYVSGRVKPELVCPQNFTSYSTGAVAGVAATLCQVANDNSALSNAYDHSEVMKAILMAGAEKTKFDSWDRTETRPLDEVFGAGEVNILNSYRILAGGEQTPGSVAHTGWDFDDLTDNVPGPDTPSRDYTITIPPGMIAEELAIVLNWHHTPDSANELPINLSLSLSREEVGGALTPLDLSNSPVDNVEHIYYRNLPEGSYRFTIALPDNLNAATRQNFGLAWQTKLGDGPRSHTVAGPTGNPSINSDQLFKGQWHLVERTFDLSTGSWSPIFAFRPNTWGTWEGEDTDGITTTNDGAFYRITWRIPYLTDSELPAGIVIQP